MSAVQAPAEVNLVPDPAPETENPEPEVAVPAVEEAVTEPAPPEQPTPTPEEIAAWQAQEQARYQQMMEQARVEAQMESRRRNALAANAKKAEEEAQATAKQALKLTLIEKGYTDVDPEVLAPALDSYAKGRTMVEIRREQQHVADGLILASAQVMGAPLPADFTPSDEAYARAESLAPMVRYLADQARQQAAAELVRSGAYVPAQVAPKIDKAIQRVANATAREGAEPYASGKGEPVAQPGELTPTTYAAMSPSEQRKLQKDNPGAVDAMFAKFVTTPQR